MIIYAGFVVAAVGLVLTVALFGIDQSWPGFTIEPRPADLFFQIGFPISLTMLVSGVYAMGWGVLNNRKAKSS